MTKIVKNRWTAIGADGDPTTTKMVKFKFAGAFCVLSTYPNPFIDKAPKSRVK